LSNLSEISPKSSSEQFEKSPFWKYSKEGINDFERKALKGILDIERLAKRLGKDSQVEFDLEKFALDFYELAFRPFGHGIRQYRQTNVVVMGSPLEYPDYFDVPKIMKKQGEETKREVAKAEDCASVKAVIQASRKIHEMVYIHPFPDGNGRITRAIVNFLFWRTGLVPPDWRYQGRDGYIEAVEQTATRNDPRIFESFLAGALLSNLSRFEQRIQSSRSETKEVRLKEIRARKLEVLRLQANL